MNATFIYGWTDKRLMCLVVCLMCGITWFPFAAIGQVRLDFMLDGSRSFVTLVVENQTSEKLMLVQSVLDIIDGTYVSVCYQDSMGVKHDYLEIDAFQKSNGRFTMYAAIYPGDVYQYQIPLSGYQKILSVEAYIRAFYLSGEEKDRHLSFVRWAKSIDF